MWVRLWFWVRLWLFLNLLGDNRIEDCLSIDSTVGVAWLNLDLFGVIVFLKFLLFNFVMMTVVFLFFLLVMVVMIVLRRIGRLRRLIRFWLVVMVLFRRVLRFWLLLLWESWPLEILWDITKWAPNATFKLFPSWCLVVLILVSIATRRDSKA